MPRSLTIERKVSALRLSHGNVFWLDMTVAAMMVVVVVVLEQGVLWGQLPRFFPALTQTLVVK